MINRILSKLTGRQHHFKVVLRYYPYGKTQPSTYIETRANVWFAERSIIADDRAIKQSLKDWFFDDIPRHLKKNGDWCLFECHYLGWFKPIK